MHANLTILDDAPTGFLVATMPQGNYKLLATFSGSDDLEPSSSLPLNVAAGGVRVGCTPSFSGKMLGTPFLVVQMAQKILCACRQLWQKMMSPCQLHSQTAQPQRMLWGLPLSVLAPRAPNIRA